MVRSQSTRPWFSSPWGLPLPRRRAGVTSGGALRRTRRGGSGHDKRSRRPFVFCTRALLLGPRRCSPPPPWRLAGPVPERARGESDDATSPRSVAEGTRCGSTHVNAADPGLRCCRCRGCCCHCCRGCDDRLRLRRPVAAATTGCGCDDRLRMRRPACGCGTAYVAPSAG